MCEQCLCVGICWVSFCILVLRVVVGLVYVLAVCVGLGGFVCACWVPAVGALGLGCAYVCSCMCLVCVLRSLVGCSPWSSSLLGAQGVSTLARRGWHWLLVDECVWLRGGAHLSLAWAGVAAVYAGCLCWECVCALCWVCV